MNEIQKNNDYLLKGAEYSAIDVAKYLLSLDPKRKYFTLNKLKFKSSSSLQGNFRLNKILHMCQIFHCMKYNKPLFKEKMTAYKNGAIIYEVFSNFYDLYDNKLTIHVEELNSEEKEFVKKNFEYFKKSDDLTLREFSHEDPAWELGRKSKEEIKLMPLNEELVSYYSEFFDDTLREIFIVK
jgi:uncharacterized phage-associated protein